MKRGSTGRRPWKQVHDHIRGLSPIPGAWFELDGDTREGAALDEG